MLLMIEKCIREGIFHVIHWYAKTNNKYMNNYDRNKESSYLKYWDVDKNLFDFTDYSQDSKFSGLAHKKVIGKMKDEFKGKIISEFAGLK